MTDWKQDKRWSDKFLPEIKSILGRYLISESPFEDDAYKNTDLIVLKLDAVRIGCRVRRSEFLEKYKDEFTIRADRPNGNKTELAKIIEGWGNYFFYAFADSNLVFWTLCDLNVFRLWFNSKIVLEKGKIPGCLIPNGDGSSSFRVFKFSDIPLNFIIGQA